MEAFVGKKIRYIGTKTRINNWGEAYEETKYVSLSKEYKEYLNKKQYEADKRELICLRDKIKFQQENDEVQDIDFNLFMSKLNKFYKQYNETIKLN